ncbi:tetratricopeptide repeat protein [Candidatus Saccharibacteria bacterium]|nr:tetratricopeptide repeat protein [Candidatus Saccharibacteria bacterium]
MLGVSIILILAIYIIFFYPIRKPAEVREAEEKEGRSEKYNSQMKKLWDVAQTSMKDRKPLRAEKALLTILKFDEKNAAAYNRLGILYAKEQNYDEAIECFEIAQSLDNNASSLHNVGLIYLETGAYEKAAMAFEQALELEEAVPARHIALSKAYEKMGQRKKAVEALEGAFKLDHSTATLRLILALYEDAEDLEKIAETTARIEQKIADDNIRREAEAMAKKNRSRRVVKESTKIMYPKKRKLIKREKAVVKPVMKTVSKPTAVKTAPKVAAKPVKKRLVSRRKLIQ